MKLIIDTINIDNLKNLDTIIFIVGITIKFTFILFKIFSKEETAEEKELDYYSRHNFKINEEKTENGKNS